MEIYIKISDSRVTVVGVWVMLLELIDRQINRQIDRELFMFNTKITQK